MSIKLSKITVEATVTIAICTYNRADFLRKCLDGLSRQTLLREGVQVLVIDNNSSDRTQDICREFERRLPLFVIREDKVGLSYARNTALANCGSEYIVFLDDDGIPDPQWLESIVEGIDKYRPDIFGGPYSPYYIGPKPAWFDDEFGSAHLGESDGVVAFPYCFSGGNMGWRASLLRRSGGFDPDLGMSGSIMRLGEETALQIQLWGEHLTRVLLTRMHMTHYVHPSKMRLRYLARRSFTYGKQLRQIDPASELLDRSIIIALIECKFFLPLILRFFLRDRSRYPFWRTYAARFLSLHCIGLGAAFAYPKQGRQS